MKWSGKFYDEAKVLLLLRKPGSSIILTSLCVYGWGGGGCSFITVFINVQKRAAFIYSNSIS